MQTKILITDSAASVAARLNRYENRGAETLPVMEEIAEDMLRIEGILFHSGGRRGGGSWKRLKEDTIRKKGSTEILRTRGSKPGYSVPGNDALFKSLTVRGAPGQILQVERRGIEFGTSIVGGRIAQTGAPSKNIPARPILKFTSQDIARWKAMIAEYLVS